MLNMATHNMDEDSLHHIDKEDGETEDMEVKKKKKKE